MVLRVSGTMKPLTSDRDRVKYIRAKPWRVAVVRVSNIGDAVSATALINAVRQKHPYSEITLVTNTVAAELVKHHPNIDRIIVFDCDRRGGDRTIRQKFFTLLFEGWRLRRQIAGRFDVALMLEGPARMLAALFPARTVIGFGKSFQPNAFFLDRKIPNERAHPLKTFRFLHYQRLLSLVDGTRSPTALPSLSLSSTAQSKAARWLADQLAGARYVVLAPGATAVTRRWPASTFVELAELIEARTGLRTVVLGGRDELELRPDFAGSPSVVAIGEHSIEVSAAIVERASALVSNDSSLMHVAVAVGTPAVAVFGASDPEIAGYEPNRLVHVTTKLPCQPCLATSCRYGALPPCLTQVSAAQVYGALAPRIEAPPDG